MDGPSHLYNSNLLLQLVKGNEALGEFFTINPIPVPNWTTSLLLMIFHSFSSAWLAEKLLLIFYASGMALSFRYLTGVLNPGNLSLSILIFPFIYSFLFHLGFYNFTFSFILLFFTTGYWLRYYSSDRIYHYLILLVLITLTYFTNLLVFGFLGLTIGLYILLHTYDLAFEEKNVREAIHFGLFKLLGLFIISIPGLAFLTIFMTHVTFYPTNQAYSIDTLIKWLNDVRPLIVYDYAKEEIFTTQFLHIILILATISIFPIGYNTNQHLRLLVKKADILLIPIGILGILYIFSPDGSGAGMMSDRYALMLYIFLVTWIAARSVSFQFNSLIIISVLVIHFTLLGQHYKDAI